MTIIAYFSPAKHCFLKLLAPPESPLGRIKALFSFLSNNVGGTCREPLFYSSMKKHFILLQIFVFVQVDVYDYYLAERCILWPDLNFLTDSAKVWAWCNPSFSKPLSIYCRYSFRLSTVFYSQYYKLFLTKYKYSVFLNYSVGKLKDYFTWYQ